MIGKWGPKWWEGSLTGAPSTRWQKPRRNNNWGCIYMDVWNSELSSPTQRTRYIFICAHIRYIDSVISIGVNHIIHKDSMSMWGGRGGGGGGGSPSCDLHILNPTHHKDIHFLFSNCIPKGWECQAPYLIPMTCHSSLLLTANMVRGAMVRTIFQQRQDQHQHQHQLLNHTSYPSLRHALLIYPDCESASTKVPMIDRL